MLAKLNHETPNLRGEIATIFQNHHLVPTFFAFFWPMSFFRFFPPSSSGYCPPPPHVTVTLRVTMRPHLKAPAQSGCQQGVFLEGGKVSENATRNQRLERWPSNVWGIKRSRLKNHLATIPKPDFFSSSHCKKIIIGKRSFLLLWMVKLFFRPRGRGHPH